MPVINIAPEKDPHTWGIAGVVLLVLILCAGGYFLYPSIKNYFGSTQKVLVTARPFTPEGIIYLTLATKGGVTTGIYTFPIASSSPSKRLVIDNSVLYTSKLVGTSSSTFLVAGLSRTKNVLSSQIFDVRQGLKPTLFFSTDTKGKAFPSYSSPLKAVVYSGSSNSSTANGDPNGNHIFTFIGGTEKDLGAGSYPSLLPDGKSALIERNNGLYLLNLTTGVAQNIWPSSKGVGANMTFAVSSGGDKIAWSSPNDGKIYIMHVRSWQPFSGQLTSSVQATAMWPVFSPRGDNLAAEEFDANTSANPRLTIFDLITPQKKVVQNLTAYDQTKTFITDWTL
jgi:hypothetical protein